MCTIFNRHVELVLDNDEGLYRERLALVEEAMTDQYPRAVLSETLRDLVERAAGLDDGDMPLMAMELLGSAMSSVDWHALAADYITEHEDEQS